MLVLKRKVGESLMIGDDIEIVIIEQDGEGVRIGIRAPKTIKVHRKEVYEEIKEANKSALITMEANSLFKEYQKTEKYGENIE